MTKQKTNTQTQMGEVRFERVPFERLEPSVGASVGREIIKTSEKHR